MQGWNPCVGAPPPHSLYLMRMKTAIDVALEGKRLTLILVEDATESQGDAGQNLQLRKQRFLEHLRQYSFKLPEDYKFNREELYDR